MLTKLYVKSRLVLEAFSRDQQGVTAIEYAIVGVAMSAIVYSVFFTGDSSLKTALAKAISTISNNISNATNAGV
jgi:pilus assembly protein Flp/PilA